MDHAVSRFSYLFTKYTTKTCTAEERNEFFQMVKKEENAFELNVLIADAVNLEQEIISDIDRERADELFESILKASDGVADVRLFPPKQNKRVWWAAAAVIFLLVSGAYFFSKKDADVPVAQKTQKTKPLKNDVAPGYQGAILTLADGRQIILDSAGNGSLTMQGSSNITKQHGKIIYNDKDVAGEEVLYNTMTTPKGRQYSVVLADGTKVWLNAASSLTFPTAFSGKERKVRLKGEAYFEVAKNDAVPFKVEAANMEVRVLGTHFNIMAYDEESSIKTTLLEGSVRVTEGSVDAFLKPGQEATLNGKGVFEIEDANIDEAIAWKNGFFQFNNADIKSIMRKLSRWYDIEVVYHGDLERRSFSGVISQHTNLSQVLNMLQLTKEVSFKMDGTKVIVSP